MCTSASTVAGHRHTSVAKVSKKQEFSNTFQYVLGFFNAYRRLCVYGVAMTVVHYTMHKKQ